MSRRVIQEQRNKTYFIEAAMELIRNHGVEHMSVKRVSDMAGFAVGTLYNYFNDLNDLLINCIDRFFGECLIKLKEEHYFSLDNQDEFINYSLSYCSYFIENPNIFRLCFLEDVGIKTSSSDLESDGNLSEIISTARNKLQKCVSDYESSSIDTLLGITSSIIHGNLLYFGTRSRISKIDLKNKIEKELQNVIQAYL